MPKGVRGSSVFHVCHNPGEAESASTLKQFLGHRTAQTLVFAAIFIVQLQYRLALHCIPDRQVKRVKMGDDMVGLFPYFGHYFKNGNVGRPPQGF